MCNTRLRIYCNIKEICHDRKRDRTDVVFQIRPRLVSQHLLFFGFLARLPLHPPAILGLVLDGLGRVPAAKLDSHEAAGHDLFLLEAI
jgi:hypothetical protein